MPQDDQLLQLYQGIAEAKLTIRFGQTSIFAEGGRRGAPVVESAGHGDVPGRLPHPLAHRVHGGRRRRASTITRCRATSRSGCAAGYFWLRDISGSQDLIVTTYLRYTF